MERASNHAEDGDKRLDYASENPRPFVRFHHLLQTALGEHVIRGTSKSTGIYKRKGNATHLFRELVVNERHT